MYSFLLGIIKLINIFLENILPKKDIIIISCQRNKEYYGNSSALFEYYVTHTDNLVYFITKNKSLYNKIKQEHSGHALFSYSIKSLFIFAQAKVIFISHGLADVSPYYISKKYKTVINLWHSPLLKKIGKAHGTSPELIQLISKLDYFVTSSAYEANFIETSFHIKKENIWITGTPRNDQIARKSKSLESKYSFLKKKVILYAPTFRDDNSAVRYFPFDDFNIKELNSFLDLHDAVILIRGHFNEFKIHGESDSIFNSKYIISANQDKFPDIQKLLAFVDVLITDYSGVYIDFLLLNKPIIFFPYDLSDYIKTRGFYYDYLQNSPGPKIYSQKDFLNQLSSYLHDDKIDSSQREIIRNKFFKYTDSNASQRVAENVKKILF